MYNFTWLKELHNKITKTKFGSWAYALFGFYVFTTIFFSIFTIDKVDGFHVANAWHGISFLEGAYASWNPSGSKAFGVMGALLSLVGTLMAAFATINRIFRFKQEVIPTILSNLMIGLGLILQGIPTDGILIAVFQGAISVAAWPIWYADKEHNDVKVNVGWQPKIALYVGFIFVASYIVVMFIYAMVGNGGYGYHGVNDVIGVIHPAPNVDIAIKAGISDVLKQWRLHIDVLAAALIIAGISAFTIFKWNGGFIILPVANIIAMIVYSTGTSLQTGDFVGFWNVPLFILMMFYNVVTQFEYWTWRKEMKAKNLDKEKYSFN